ncbi:MAG: hypothetical protein GY822_01135 [Deltaproteobacteria bacterium]|nr:hypothetical protein [Deltaproteobacteria bacterium]
MRRTVAEKMQSCGGALGEDFDVNEVVDEVVDHYLQWLLVVLVGVFFASEGNGIFATVLFQKNVTQPDFETNSWLKNSETMLGSDVKRTVR